MSATHRPRINITVRCTVYGALIGAGFGLLSITGATLWLLAAPFDSSPAEAIAVTAGLLGGPICVVAGQCIGAVLGLRKEFRTGDNR